MLRRIKARFVCLAAAIVFVMIFAGCHSLAYVHGAPEDHYQLWMGVLKPFGGPMYYVGSEGDFSYFRGHGIFCDRYKARTSELKLPRTFPFGREKSYIVTLDMIPE
jgi:hypothetical protein